VSNHPIVLFDGACGLCNATVTFVLRRDRRARFRFAALQSLAGQKALNDRGLAYAGLDYVILIEGSHVSTHSTAALRILAGLGGGWALLGRLGLFCPRRLRDVVYRWIARHRYAWFGRLAACHRPTPEEADRFLDQPGEETWAETGRGSR
jgi:predicted DCC family thiol-disulfide oxidoreductase YuxK